MHRQSRLPIAAMRATRANRTFSRHLTPRIMSVDRVPGVKMSNSGAPVRETMKPNAVNGANALAAAVAKQRAQRADHIKDAKEASKLQATSSSSVLKRKYPPLSALLGGLDAKIDGQHLAKDVVARALRRRSMRLDDGERPLRLLFAGPSGVGKTAMATALCEALLGSCVPDKNFKRECASPLSAAAAPTLCLSSPHSIHIHFVFAQASTSPSFLTRPSLTASPAEIQTTSATRRAAS